MNISSTGLSQKVVARGSAKPAVTGRGPTIMGLLRASSTDAPLSELRKAFPLKATATGLAGVIVPLSQSSREAHLRSYLNHNHSAVGCRQNLKQDEHSPSRHDQSDHAGPVCGSAASSAGPRDHHLHMWRRLWRQGVRRLQAATGLGMQLQKPARPDLRARGVGLEGCSLYHAQPRPCQPAFTSARVGRTAIL